MIKYVTVSNSRFHFPAAETGALIPPRDKRGIQNGTRFQAIACADAAFRLVNPQGGLLRCVNTDVRARGKGGWARLGLTTLSRFHPTLYHSAYGHGAIIGFSSVLLPPFPSPRNGRHSHSAEGIIPRDSFVVTTIIALFGEVIEFSRSTGGVFTIMTIASFGLRFASR